ncbi:MAG: MFS transporter [Thermaerobacter sp.]|nr:MFS transporter [Thermaerobacter sp.]
MDILLPFRLLRSNRNLRNLWLGETISYFGDNFYSIAIMWYVFQLTGSGLQMGLVLVSSFVPQVVAGPLLGTLSDRWNRKAMMRSASVIQALLTGLLASLIYARAADMPLIYVITIALSVVELAYRPARAGMFPDLVDAADLMAGNALFSTSQQVARIVGSSLGGLFVAFAGVSTAVGFDAITFLASAAFLQWVVHTPVRAVESEPQGQRSSFVAELHGG